MVGVMAENVSSVDTARAAQAAHHEGFLERYGEQLREMEAYGGAATFTPPTTTNPAKWEGIAQYCAVMHRVIWENERHALLKAGKGPFYCPVHEDKPEKGWKPSGCFQCAWGTIDEPGPVMQDALRLARDLAKPFACPGCTGQFRRGHDYIDHVNDAHGQAA